MDSIFTPESFCSTMCSYPTMMRKRRRVMNLDNWDQIFSEMFLPSYEVSDKRKSASNNSSDITENKEESTVFTKKMKLNNFKPSDIQIRVTADKKVLVEAKQEVKEEKEGFHSYQLREFKQSLDVPENINIEQLTSSFSDKGELTITAPLLCLPEPEKEEETKLPVAFEYKSDGEEVQSATEEKKNE